MDSVASLYNRNSLNDIIEKTSKNIFIPITVGGGIRSVDDANRILRSGADKIAITAAVENPRLLEDLQIDLVIPRLYYLLRQKKGQMEIGRHTPIMEERKRDWML